MSKLLVRRLRSDAVIPQRMTEHAAGLDLSAAIDEPITLEPGARAAVGTGIAVAVAPGYEAQVRPRSGLARGRGVTVLNSPGTIDADYRGELLVLLINFGHEPVRIESGQRIAQLVVAPVELCVPEEVDDLPTTVRGADGFGSTGG